MMSYCPFCGAQVSDGAVFCSRCGRTLTKGGEAQGQGYAGEQQTYTRPAGRDSYQTAGDGGYPEQPDYPYDPRYDQGSSVQVEMVDEQSGLKTAIKVFMVIGCLANAITIIGLAWCIPMTVSVFHSFRDNRPVGIAMKICTLLFVNLIAGILLLCLKDPRPQQQYY